MAGNKIRGITIDIAGDTSALSKSLREADAALKTTQKQLNDVNKLLKLDPKNTELLRQKQELLNKAIKNSEKNVDELKKAQEQLGERTEKNAAQYDAIEREIIACETMQRKWKNQLDEMEPKARTLKDTFQDVSKSAGEFADKTRALSAAAGAGALAILGNAVHAAATADDLKTLARNTGFTVEELQKMQFASDRIDVSMEAMTGSVTKLTKNMASGSKVFEELGVAIRDENGNMRDATDVWYDTLAALGQIENETERDAKSMEVFGKSAMELSGIIDDGGQALKDFGQEAEDAGLILSGETLQSANQLNDEIDKLKATTTAALLKVGAELAETLAPALENIVNKVAEALSWFAQLDGQTQTIILTVLGVVAALSPLASIISAIAAIIPVIAGAFAALASPVGAVVLAIAALIATGIELYQNWDVICARAAALRDSVVQAFDNVKAGVGGALEELKTKVSDIFESIKNFITEKIEAAKAAVMDAVDRIKNAFNFEWSLPQIKLPHFKVSGGEAPWGFGGMGRLPSISVDWYKRAYDNAVMFTRPTVLATASGLKGFGDGNGSELVIGTNTLMNMIEQSNETQTAELGRIAALLSVIANNGMSVQLQGDARQMFRVVRQQNRQFTLATGKSGFDY